MSKDATDFRHRLLKFFLALYQGTAVKKKSTPGHSFPIAGEWLASISTWELSLADALVLHWTTRKARRTSCRSHAARIRAITSCNTAEGAYLPPEPLGTGRNEMQSIKGVMGHSQSLAPVIPELLLSSGEERENVTKNFEESIS
jgi:hypothetical protein